MKINHFKLNDKPGALKASFVAVFPLSTAIASQWCVNMTFFQKDDGAHWFGYPQKEYTNKEGQKKYFKLSFPEDSGKESFEMAVKHALSMQIPAFKQFMNTASAHSDEFSMDGLPF